MININLFPKSVAQRRINWSKYKNMSLECPTSPVYRTSVEQKIHSRNAAKVYRYGSPKIRDQLRNKCRLRVREARQANFSRRRLADITEELDLDKLLREELANLESDLKLQEEIYMELRNEMNEWFVQELEAEEASLIDAADADNNNASIICPICQQRNLSSTSSDKKQESGTLFNCKCGVHFNFSAKPFELHKILHTQIELHGQRCDANLTFYLEPQSVVNVMVKTDDSAANNLCAICDKCDYFYSF
ncbi:PREDICTED: RIP-like protein [Rhagoletis zephyria]|uniref:RIP-like protein n=1 Tax=Rhagoletis zephyria TaxID=28612 RepID=UPI00081139D9|nr:PREDICTED: RIP-like protein [Rhagoletis zephyria]